MPLLPCHLSPHPGGVLRGVLRTPVRTGMETGKKCGKLWKEPDVLHWKESEKNGRENTKHGIHGGAPGDH